jgi:hypothetical protein
MKFLDIEKGMPPVDVEVIVEALGGITTAMLRNDICIGGTIHFEFTGKDRFHFIGCSNAHIIGWRHKDNLNVTTNPIEDNNK